VGVDVAECGLLLLVFDFVGKFVLFCFYLCDVLVIVRVGLSE